VVVAQLSRTRDAEVHHRNHHLDGGLPEDEQIDFPEFGQDRLPPLGEVYLFAVLIVEFILDEAVVEQAAPDLEEGVVLALAFLETVEEGLQEGFLVGEAVQHGQCLDEAAPLEEDVQRIHRSPPFHTK
jgi:hypothetical protein